MKTLPLLLACMLLLGACHQQEAKQQEAEIACDSTIEPNNDGILVDYANRRTYQVVIPDMSKLDDESDLRGLLYITDSVAGTKDSVYITINWEYQELILEEEDQILDILSEGGSGHFWMMTKVDLRRKEQISCQSILLD